jgi:hypothetical protein
MPSTVSPETAEIHKSFNSVRQIDAGLLNVGYV